MLANYHAHTWRCGHATGTEEAYIQLALQNGCKIFGFSDHTPYPFPNSYRSTYRMSLEQIDNYVETVLNLRKAFAGQIEIPLGLEVEYYPNYFPKLLDALRGYPIDYFLLGQHFLGNEIDNWYCGRQTDDVQKLRQYCNQCIEAMETGRFTYLAHPDLIPFTGDLQIYQKEMRRLCLAAQENNIPLELNLLGLGTHRHYPNPNFWKIAGEVGAQAIWGYDAHDTESFTTYPVIEGQAQALTQRYGLRRLETILLRKPV